METNKPFCKRCLLSETDESELFKNVTELIAAMPEEMKTDGDSYRARISACGGCDMLYRGMCLECGCYIELRAAKAVMHCPAAKPKW